MPLTIGLDVGTRTIGVARADDRACMARPLLTLRREGTKKDVARLLRALEREEVAAFVVGLPLQLDGDEGRSVRLARQVGELLAAESGIPVHYQDERYSTVEATRILHLQGKNSRQQRDVIDETAAAVILQDWLDAGSAPPSAAARATRELRDPNVEH